jgi:putative methyltransferase (TIGR04325 family)
MQDQKIVGPIREGFGLRLLNRIRGAQRAQAIRFTGNYKSWQDAEKDSTGYDSPEILAKTRGALLKVLTGEAAFERDSVTFREMQYEYPLLAGLLHAAISSGGRLSVLDFGGALGSTYFQCHNFLSVVKELRWSVVDQPAHVACGKVDFASNELQFYESIDECLKHEQPNVLLLSAVLQYLPRPYEFLANVLKHGLSSVVVDRTAFLLNAREDLLTVQHVPDRIYRARFPAWFLSEERFLSVFERDYELVATFRALDNRHPEGRKAVHKGFIFSLKQ